MKERAAGLNGSSHSPRRRLWNWSRRSCTVCAFEVPTRPPSLAQTVQERRDQFHSLRLGEWLDPFNPAARSFLDRASGPFLQQTGDPVAAQQLALQTLANIREQQASSLAYFDVFWVLAVVMVALVFVVLLMKRSVAEKGARIGSE